MSDALFESRIDELELLARGKVRDIYAVDDDHLLIVTTDRLSAFDVVMPKPVPGKGRILTQISLFWFGMMKDRGCRSRFPDRLGLEGLHGHWCGLWHPATRRTATGAAASRDPVHAGDQGGSW